MVGKYPAITLCGSTRFKDQFLEAQKHLTLDSPAPYTPLHLVPYGRYMHPEDLRISEVTPHAGVWIETRKAYGQILRMENFWLLPEVPTE